MPAFGPVSSAPVSSIGGTHVAAGGLIFHGSNVLPNQWQITSGHLLFGGATPVAVLKAPRVTWMGAEALHVGVASLRVTWSGVEVLRSVSTGPTLSVVTWMGAEVAHSGAAQSRVTWMGVEVLRTVRKADTGWVSLIAA